jgi:hypothetical protein
MSYKNLCIIITIPSQTKRLINTLLPITQSKEIELSAQKKVTLLSYRVHLNITNLTFQRESQNIIDCSVGCHPA